LYGIVGLIFTSHHLNARSDMFLFLSGLLLAMVLSVYLVDSINWLSYFRYVFIIGSVHDCCCCCILLVHIGTLKPNRTTNTVLLKGTNCHSFEATIAKQWILLILLECCYQRMILCQTLTAKQADRPQ